MVEHCDVVHSQLLLGPLHGPLGLLPVETTKAVF